MIDSGARRGHGTGAVPGDARRRTAAASPCLRPGRTTSVSGGPDGIQEAGGERARLECGRDRSPTGPRRLGGALTAAPGTHAATVRPRA